MKSWKLQTCEVYHWTGNHAYKPKLLSHFLHFLPLGKELVLLQISTSQLNTLSLFHCIPFALFVFLDAGNGDSRFKWPLVLKTHGQLWAFLIHLLDCTSNSMPLQHNWWFLTASFLWIFIKRMCNTHVHVNYTAFKHWPVRMPASQATSS